MTYVQLDDRMADNPKVVALSDKAYRAYVESLCYASGNLTDGVLSDAIVSARPWKRSAAELVGAGLWEPRPDGYVIHDYLLHQRSRAEVLSLKEKRAEAGKRGSKRQANAEANAEANATPTTTTTPTTDPESHTQTRARPKRVTEVDADFRAEITEQFKDRASPERVNAEIDDALGHKAAEKRNDKRAYVRVWLNRARWGDERNPGGGAPSAARGGYTSADGARGLVVVGAGGPRSEYADDFHVG